MENRSPDRLRLGNKTALLTLLLLPTLLLSLSHYGSGLVLQLPLYFLLPIFAVWLGLRYRRATVLSLLVLGLLPAVVLNLGSLGIFFGLPKVICLISLVLVLAATSGGATMSVNRLARKGWVVAGATALLLYLLWQSNTLPARPPFLQPRLAYDLVALSLASIFLLTLSWSAVGTWLNPAHRGRIFPDIALLVVAVLTTLVQTKIIDGEYMDIFFGRRAPHELVYAGCFIATCVFGVRWKTIAFAVLACAGVGWASITGFQLQGLVLYGMELRAATIPPLLSLICIAWLGECLAGFWPSFSFGEEGRTRRIISVVIILIVVLVLVPAQSKYFSMGSTNALLVLGGIGFIVGNDFPRRGPYYWTLIVAAIYVGAFSQFDGLDWDDGRFLKLVSDLFPTVLVFLTFALAGATVVRSKHTAVVKRDDGFLAQIDISSLAPVVQQLDNAATLRSFLALLVPALAMWNAGYLVAGATEFFQLTNPDAQMNAALPFILVILFIALLGTLSSLAFIVWDWLDREEAFRPLSFATGASIAFLLAIIAGISVGGAVYIIEDEFPDYGLYILVSFSFLVILAVILWRRTSAVWQKWLLAAAAATLSLIGLYHVLTSDAFQGAENIAMIPVSILFAAWLFDFYIRAHRVRMTLAQPLPRDWLFGSLAGKRFWTRMGALVGLPSSLWSKAAFKEVSFWAFLMARPLVYLGIMLLGVLWPAGIVVIIAGHGLFYAGKRIAAAKIWKPGEPQPDHSTVLFLRSFEDDQFDFKRPWWNLYMRWFDLWSFRRNIEETMVDEVAQYGKVVALGRPQDAETPFGAARHYSSHDDWQTTIEEAALKARAVVLVAGKSSGLQFELDLLKRHGLLEKTILLFQRGEAHMQANSKALAFMLAGQSHDGNCVPRPGLKLVALILTERGPFLMQAEEPTAAAYVLALRAFFQHKFGDLPMGSSARAAAAVSTTTTYRGELHQTTL